MSNDTTRPRNLRSLAKIVRIILGPEEEWDDTAVSLVLELRGLDSSKSELRFKTMVDKIINEKRTQGKEIKDSLLKVQSLLDEHLKAQSGKSE
jgi:hypothetical protein